MKPSQVRRIVDATLLLVPILGALIASAAVRAAEPAPTVTLMTMDDKASESGHEAVLVAIREGADHAAARRPHQAERHGDVRSGLRRPRRKHHLSGADPHGDGENCPARRCPRGRHRNGNRDTHCGNTYSLGEEKSATATITDASGSAGSPAGPAPQPASAPGTRTGRSPGAGRFQAVRRLSAPSRPAIEGFSGRAQC
jgi:hypothetical protein